MNPLDTLTDVLGPPDPKVTRNTPDWTIRINQSNVVYVTVKEVQLRHTTYWKTIIDARSTNGVVNLDLFTGYTETPVISCCMWHGKPQTPPAPHNFDAVQAGTHLPINGSPVDTLIHWIIQIVSYQPVAVSFWDQS